MMGPVAGIVDPGRHRRCRLQLEILWNRPVVLRKSRKQLKAGGNDSDVV